METEELEDALRAFFASNPHGASCVYLYGSRARGTARPDSDVDLAVLFETARPPGYAGLPLALEAAIEERLGLPVQVVDLERVPADLFHRVVRDGRLVLERDRSRRVRFEVLRRNEYFDLQPMLRAYRDHVTGRRGADDRR